MEKTKNNKWRRILIGVLLTFALLITACLAALPMTVSAAEGDVEINATNFPDDNFRSWIAENIAGADDGVLTAEEIEAVTEMDLFYKGISDLTGIQYFTALTWLDCSYNQLTALDVSQNTALEKLYCNDNYLTALDVRTNTGLSELNCSSNQLTSLTLGENTVLSVLDCTTNKLTALDVRANTGLTELYCSQNQLTSIDLGNNTDLTVAAWLQVDEQTITLDFTWKLDMSTFVPDVSKVTIVSGGKTDANGFLLADDGADTIVYTYDTGLEDRTMEVTVTVANPHTHSYDETTKQCACGKLYGSGTEADPYIVTTFEQLNAALHSTENETNYVKLGNTISWYHHEGDLELDETNAFVLDLNGCQLSAADAHFIVYKTSAIVRNGQLRLDLVQSYYGNGNIEIIDVEMDVRKIDATGGTLTLSDCNVFCRYLSTDNSGTIVARDVTIKYSKHLEGEIGYECLSGSLTLDGVTYTESIEILNYHTHTDANGDCICDREGDALHTDTGFDSTCDVCGENITHIEFSKVSLTLGGDIGINYFFTLGDAVLSNEAYFLVTYPDGSTERISVSDDLIGTPKGDTSGNTYYKVTARVAAKEMADDVKVELFVNEIPVKAFNYSIQQYANVIFADASSEAGLVELVKKMLNYGAASQIALGYNTDKLANSVLDESDKTVNAVDASALTGATTNGTVSGFEYQMFSCILETKTTLRQYFTLPESSVSEYTFTIDSESVTPTQTTVEGTTMYYIDVANIAARDMDVVHTLVITKDGDTRTITCSVQSYMKAVLTKNSDDEALVNAINAMYEYGDAAKQYLAD